MSGSFLVSFPVMLPVTFPVMFESYSPIIYNLFFDLLLLSYVFTIFFVYFYTICTIFAGVDNQPPLPTNTVTKRVYLRSHCCSIWKPWQHPIPCDNLFAARILSCCFFINIHTNSWFPIQIQISVPHFRNSGKNLM